MDKTPDLTKIAAEVIKHLGGSVKAAQLLGVPGNRYQTVQAWTKLRIPAEWCPVIERVTKRQYICEQMRPDVEWSVLRGNRVNVKARAREEQAEA